MRRGGAEGGSTLTRISRPTPSPSKEGNRNAGSLRRSSAAKPPIPLQRNSARALRSNTACDKPKVSLSFPRKWESRTWRERRATPLDPRVRGNDGFGYWFQGKALAKAGHLSLILLFIGIFLSAAEADEGRQQRFLYNTDGNNMFLYKGYPMTPEDVYGYVDEIADAGITTLSVSCHVGMDMNYQGEHADLYGSHPTPEEAERLKDPAKSKPLTGERTVSNFRGLIAAGHDPLGLIISRAQEKGMECFVSFRLNEVHSVDKPPSKILSKFWMAHPEWRVAEIGDETPQNYLDIVGPRANPIVAGWFAGGLNFAVPEVRARKLAQLREICERYPIDGLEIDFQRFPIYFPFGKEKENIGAMNGWMADVREMLDAVGKKRGRPFHLSARILARPEQNMGIGLDPFAWAENGLIDSVTAAHFLHNNFPIPVESYRKRFPDSLPVYASIEVEREADTYREIAQALWDGGVDGIMLFNHFTSRERGEEPDFSILPELGRTAARHE
jgi:hypothetical protein